MPTLIRILLLTITIIAVTACAPTSVQQSYITVRQPETLTEENTGEEFEVLSGDTLKILETKSCAGAKGVCWKVSSAKTGKVALVNAELVQDRQEVYIDEKGRTFANGTFQSKYPKVTININPDFKYAGVVSERKDVMSIGGNRELYLKSDFYMFVSHIDIKTNTKSRGLEVHRTFIKILQPDNVYSYGEVIYKVNPGDTLEKLYHKTCRTGYGECWGVRNLKDGQIGIIGADRAKSKHQIYDEKDIEPQNLPSMIHENKLKRGVNIVFKRIDTYFSGDLFSKMKNKLYVGVDQFADKNYQFCIRKIYPGMKSPVVGYLFEKGGYIVPSCLLIKDIGRVVGASQDMLIVFGYYEDISEQGFSCSAFPINGTTLNEEEIKFIEEFNDRSKLAFEIVHSQ